MHNIIPFLQVVQRWGTDEVVAWLEREGLDVLSSMARDQGFDGGILLALYSETKKERNSYKSDCSDLGIPAGVIQLKLKGRLVVLFG